MKRGDRSGPLDPRGRRRAVSAAAVLGLAAAGCATLEQLPARLLDARTPRERYEARLASLGLTTTALGRDWKAAAERALAEAPLVASPHREEGYLPPGEPTAVALRILARLGQEIEFDLQLVGDSTTLVFLEAWLVGPDSTRGLRRVASSDSGARALTFAPRESGEYILRAQPELLRGGRFILSLRVVPTLAFPVRHGRESDIGSRFGAPRAGARRHHGVDITARRGTPALATGDAVVTHVGTSPLGGNVVWLRDQRGNGLYYAHLDRQYITPGARVRAGDTVGFVGNTGNARRTPPHLHFGVYRRGEGPVDPWWFLHRPPGEPPRLAADTTLLGGWVRTPRDAVELRAAPSLRATTRLTLPRHTAMRVIAAVGPWYRVRLPDGLSGYLGARLIEPARHAVGTARLAAHRAVLTRPRQPIAPSDVLAEIGAGDSVAVIGRFGEYQLVRTAAGTAGWVVE
jgi:murein DD-endopeptidase MepM/ murein hydrolase activator NlpD/SH3-like domain-containing protein